MRRVIVAVIAAVTCLTACPPPITPHPPPVTPISQCKDVFPVNKGGFTRPLPTNKPIFILGAPEDYTGQKIIWLDRNCNYYYLGALDYRYPGTDWCRFRPDAGDRLYSAQNGFIIPIPRPCT